MAEQAQKEPTMEEILSSIRKIIADDSASAVETQETSSFDVGVANTDSFDELELADDPLETDMPETEADVLTAITQPAETVEDMFEEDVLDVEPLELEEESFSAADDSFDLPEPIIEDVADTFVEEPEVYEEPAVAMPADIAPELPTPESAIADTATASAVAGSLSKLLSNVEFGEEAGGSKTIDSLVGELLRPMLKDWLDENLPGIVEKHVEAEVARIARMAR
ncbi:MAG: DUF2497 domain-containing protein [Pseudomonadota bacterium]